MVENSGAIGRNRLWRTRRGKERDRLIQMDIRVISRPVSRWSMEIAGGYKRQLSTVLPGETQLVAWRVIDTTSRSKLIQLRSVK